MSKNKEEQQPVVESGSPAFVQELLSKGTAIITASSPEALAEIVNDIPAECKYAAGAVGRNRETGEYSLRLDLIKP